MKNEVPGEDRGKDLSLPADESLVGESLNRRAESRVPAPQLQRIEVKVPKTDGGWRKLAAVLVDFSDAGLGLDMFVPLKVGSQVAVHGDLRSPELTLCVDGRARVAHSRRLPGGNYRIGLALREMAYSKSA